MGLKQGLEQVIAAAAVSQDRGCNIRFAFVGDGNQRYHLQELAAGLPNVTFHPMEPEATFPDVLAAADVLLVSERSTAVDMSLPSKLTSYFVAGRPVVAAVSLDGATAQELTRSGGGVVVPAGQPGALVDAVLGLSADDDLVARVCAAAREHAARSMGAEDALLRAERFAGQVLAGV
jgi:glycosyltransferase involved in cell wall biosynthesis